MIIETIKETIKDAFFPNICICGKWGVVICDDCYKSIPTNKRDLCPICKKLSDYGKTCKLCRSKSSLTGVMIFGKHEGVLKELLWHLKYEFIKELSQPLAKLLVNKYIKFIKDKDFMITFVPISKERANWRGFNQAELLAREISKLSQKKAVSIFEKRNTTSQVGLHRSERINNMKGKIQIINKDLELKNKKVLIIDDVITTGATLEECANQLRKAGAREVWGLVVSRD